MVLNTPIIDFHLHLTTEGDYADWLVGWHREYVGEATIAHLRQVFGSPQSLSDRYQGQHRGGAEPRAQRGE